MKNNELESFWKEAVVAFTAAISQYLPGKTEENHENLQPG
jgi:hypothetical protein